jgi:hypothetical protein
MPAGCEGDVMTMYLPNRDIRPTGYEAGEFLELPPMHQVEWPSPAPAADLDEDESPES